MDPLSAQTEGKLLNWNVKSTPMSPFSLGQEVGKKASGLVFKNHFLMGDVSPTIPWQVARAHGHMSSGAAKWALLPSCLDRMGSDMSLAPLWKVISPLALVGRWTDLE